MDHIGPAHEINVAPDRATVWVNAGDGSCVGRFSKRFGVDVHTTATEQLAGRPECLMCTHGPADRAAWLLFVDAMRQHHGIHVPDQLIPWS
jgi:hypothetical protein